MAEAGTDIRNRNVIRKLHNAVLIVLILWSFMAASGRAPPFMSWEIMAISHDINPPGMYTPRRGRRLCCRAAAGKVRFAPFEIEGQGSRSPSADIVSVHSTLSGLGKCTQKCVHACKKHSIIIDRLRIHNICSLHNIYKVIQ